MSRDKLFEVLAAVFAAAGLGISYKLLQIHIGLTSGQTSMQSSCSIGGLGKGSSCEEVALSAYSQVGPIPLAALAMGFYAALFVLLLWKLVIEPNKKEISQIVFNLTSLGLIVAVVMAVISNVVLAKFCLWCAGLWGVNFALWIIGFKVAGHGFGALLSGNFVSFNAEAKEMNQSSMFTWMGVAAGAFALVTFLGAAVESNAVEKANRGGVDRAIRKFNAANVIFVAPEILADGPNVKGVSQDKAIISIVKFSDFQCPACQAAARAIKPFFLRHKDKIRFTYHNYPLDNACNEGGGNHHMACDAAYAAICAGKEGKFFDMHDMLFDADHRSLNKAYIKEAASVLGLDEAKFAACIESDETKARVKQQLAWGEAIQLRATPTFIVNGRKVEGGFTFMQWEALLKGLEKAKKK